MITRFIYIPDACQSWTMDYTRCFNWDMNSHLSRIFVFHVSYNNSFAEFYPKSFIWRGKCSASNIWEYF